MEPEEKAAVFKIRLETGSSDPTKFGAGFLIGPNLILTAYHVVTPGTNRFQPVARRGTIRIGLAEGAFPEAKLIQWDVQTDWALLQCDAIPETIRPLPLRDPRTLGREQEERLWNGWGFPRDAPHGIACGGELKDFRGSAESPESMQLRYDEAQAAKALEPDGLSGSPMMIKGCAVGIIQAKHQDSGGRILGPNIYATPVSQVLDHVDESILTQLDLRTRFDSEGASKVDKKNQLRVDWISRNYDPVDQLRQTGAQGFQLRIRFAASFQGILRGEFEPPLLSPLEILLKPQQWKLVLLHAPGGAGKSAFLCDLCRQALRTNTHVFLLNLNREVAAQLKKDAQFSNLFQLCAVIGSYEDFQEAVKSPLNVLILADGLNEMERSVSEEILKLLERSLAAEAQTQLIVADRMNARDSAASFKRATLALLERDQIRAALAGLNAQPEEKDDLSWDLLSNPFFLNLYLTLVDSEPNRQWIGYRVRRRDMFHQYFRQVAKLDDAETSRLAGAAFQAYKDFQRTEFALSVWRRRLPDLADRLERAGVVVALDERHCAFRHQLLHDYLVGVHVAECGSAAWMPKTFDEATFRANSGDSLFFCAEELAARARKAGEEAVKMAETGDARIDVAKKAADEAGRQVDEFIILLYDWNVQFPFELIADLDYAQEAPIKPLGLALSAVFALRIHDRVAATEQQSRDTLNRIQWPEIRQFAEATDPKALQEAVRKIDFPAQYAEWKNLFLTRSGSPADELQIAALGHDPLMGWTAANVLRTLRLTAERQAQIRLLYRAFQGLRDGSRRWRVVHALGCHYSPENVELLRTAAEKDSYDWVVYGAVRSLMEIASRPDCPERDQILSWLDGRLRPGAHPLLLKAFRRTVAFHETDCPWLDEAERLLKKCSAFTEAADQSDLRRSQERVEEIRRELGCDEGGDR